MIQTLGQALSGLMPSYRFLKDIAKKTPKFMMGDGAPEITKAGTEVKNAPYLLFPV